MKKNLLITAFSAFTGLTFAQVSPPAGDTLPPRTVELPFRLSEEKRLSEEDIANKREGVYVTGIPEILYNPINRFGAGGEVFIFNNGRRDDPFFEFTPYRQRFAASLLIFQTGRVNGGISVDIPYLFNTRWRFRAEFQYQNNPDWQYFGVGAQTMQGLSYIDRQTGETVTNARFSRYAENLERIRPGRPEAGETGLVSDALYHDVNYTSYLPAIALERTFLGGRGRLMFGYELLNIVLEAYDGRAVEGITDPGTGEALAVSNGRTKLTEDFLDPNGSWRRFNISGYDGGRIGLLQMGIMYDTRDLEPDPSRGIFAEYAQEFSAPIFLSQFTFSKHLIQVRSFNRVLPGTFGRVVLASRAALGYIRGSNLPITEFMDVWSSEMGGIEALGGLRSLRGYRQSRFVGPVTGFVNVELRSRLHQTTIFNQHLAFSLVPFIDAGRVWDRLGDINLRNFAWSPGVGGRIAWNQATILLFDYARSREDAQFFFGFNHVF